MKMQIGANGSLNFALLPSGDITITGVENDTLTSEQVVETIHPAALQASLIKLLGGGALATEVVSLAFMTIPTLVAALPK
jgi:hypothetical protein